MPFPVQGWVFWGQKNIDLQAEHCTHMVGAVVDSLSTIRNDCRGLGILATRCVTATH